MHNVSLHGSFIFKFKKRDEVLVSAQTHVATVHAIEAVGAKPIFIDSSEVDGNISLKDLEKK